MGPLMQRAVARVRWRATVLLAAALTAAAFTGAPAAQERGAFIDLPDVRLWVVDTGGSGDPVVLLHPNTGTVEVWKKQIPALVAAGYRVIAFDRPGWGRSTAQPGATPLSVAEDLDVLADRLGLGRFALVGVAGGGYIALDYAAWRPERVRSLVIANSGLGLKNDAEGDAFRRNSAIPDFHKFPAEVREMSPTYRGLNPEGVKAWKAIQSKAKQPGAADHALRTPNTLEKVAAIAMPVLVVAGDVDLTTPSGAMRLWARSLKHYDWLLVPEAGHALPWEQPDVFNAAVIDFLRKH